MWNDAHLAALLGTPAVAVAPLANFNPASRVTLNLQRFDSTPAEMVVIDAVWVVQKSSNKETRSGRTLAR